MLSPSSSALRSGEVRLRLQHQVLRDFKAQSLPWLSNQAPRRLSWIQCVAEFVLAYVRNETYFALQVPIYPKRLPGKFCEEIEPIILRGQCLNSPLQPSSINNHPESSWFNPRKCGNYWCLLPKFQISPETSWNKASLLGRWVSPCLLLCH